MAGVAMRQPDSSALLPDYLKTLWESVGQQRISEDEFQRAQEGCLSEYEAQWTQALCPAED